MSRYRVSGDSPDNHVIEPIQGPSADSSDPPVGVLVRSATYLAVRHALLNRWHVRALYDGHERLLCAHVLGLNKRGEEQCLFYQFGGYSRHGIIIPGSPANWRCMLLAKLEILEIKPGPWCTGPRVTAETSARVSALCVVSVDVSVPFAN